MKTIFSIVGVRVFISSGPILQMPLANPFQVEVDIRSWHEMQAAKFVSTTASSDTFRMEGDTFLLIRSPDDNFVALSFPFGKDKATDTMGYVMLITTQEIPNKF